MLVLYSLTIKLYILAIHFFALFNNKAKKMIRGRCKWEEKLEKQVNKDINYIWFHCASLGEFEQARPLIEALKNHNDNNRIILTFYSPSGYEMRYDYKYADIVCYLPFDSRLNAKKFIKIVNPKYAVFVKYEFWHYFIDELHKQKIPIYLISAVFRKSQLFFKKHGKFYLRILRKYKCLFVQDQESAKLLASKDIHNVIVCGDTRIDRVLEISKEMFDNRILKSFAKDNFVLVAGSTWNEDDKILAEIINNDKIGIKLIIAPHEVTEENIKSLESKFDCSYVRFSKVNDILHSDIKVIIIDSIGILSKIYRFGNFAYIGGGFGRGIHNTLEAAVYGIPVAFGPNYKKFNEAKDLIDNKIAFSINTSFELQNILNEFKNNEERKTNCKSSVEAFFNNSKGATKIILKSLIHTPKIK